MPASTDGKNPMAMSAPSDSSNLRGSRVVSGTTRMLTPGASRSINPIKPGISSAAVASAMDSTKVAEDEAGSKALGDKASLSCSNAA